MERPLRRLSVRDVNNPTVIRHLYRAIPIPPRSRMIDKEAKVRRQIANDNERKRMQSINNGFEKLKALLQLEDPDKFISKSSVLQEASRQITELYDIQDQMASEIRNLRQFIRDNLGVEPDIPSSVGTFAVEMEHGPAITSSSETPIIELSRSEKVTHTFDAILSSPEKLTEAKRRRRKTVFHKSLKNLNFDDQQLQSEIPTCQNDGTDSQTADDAAGRSNLEIILTAIQHIESSGSTDGTNADMSGNHDGLNDRVDVRPPSNEEGTLILSQSTKSKQSVPTIFLRPVDSTEHAGVERSAKIKAVSSSNQITQNILLLNSPTVTLTSPSGGKLQYHLAAVTNK